MFLIEGIVLVVLGLLAIIIPPIATIAVTIFMGWLFLISGVVGLVTTFWARHAPGFWWSLLSAALAIAAGIVLLAWPVSNTIPAATAATTRNPGACRTQNVVTKPTTPLIRNSHPRKIVTAIVASGGMTIASSPSTTRTIPWIRNGPNARGSKLCKRALQLIGFAQVD